MASYKVKEILLKVEQQISQKGIKGGVKKWKNLVLIEAEQHSLSYSDVRELALELDISFVSPPYFARCWLPSICKTFLSVKYTNPGDDREFVVMITSRSIFGISGIIHHTPNGYKDPKWFRDFVQDLDLYHANYVKSLASNLQKSQGKDLENSNRRAFGKYINDPINEAFSTKGMTIEQIHAVNAFLHKYIPDLDGICLKCFKISLPHRGAGVRWFSQNLENCEVRLSEVKPFGLQGQQKMYVTHQYIVKQENLWVKWDGTFVPPVLDPNNKQLYTHLCWQTYDYEFITKKLSHQITICQCQKT